MFPDIRENKRVQSLGQPHLEHSIAASSKKREQISAAR